MPTYEYACTACGQHLEVHQRLTDDPLTTCAACGGALRKVFHPAGIVFKGSGFYATDSRSGSKSSSAGATAAGSGTSDASPSSDAATTGTSTAPDAGGSNATTAAAATAAPASPAPTAKPSTTKATT